MNEVLNCSVCGDEVYLKEDEDPPRFICVCEKETCCNKAIKVLSVEKKKLNNISILMGIRIQEISTALASTQKEETRLLKERQES